PIDVAVQISAVPAPAFARWTSVHCRPAPETVTDCFAVAGPSDAMNATSAVFVAVALNGGVVTVPVPSTKVSGAVAGPVPIVDVWSPAMTSTAANFTSTWVGAEQARI